MNEITKPKQVNKGKRAPKQIYIGAYSALSCVDYGRTAINLEMVVRWWATREKKPDFSSILAVVRIAFLWHFQVIETRQPLEFALLMLNAQFSTFISNFMWNFQRFSTLFPRCDVHNVSSLYNVEMVSWKTSDQTNYRTHRPTNTHYSHWWNVQYIHSDRRLIFLFQLMNISRWITLSNICSIFCFHFVVIPLFCRKFIGNATCSTKLHERSNKKQLNYVEWICEKW